MVATGRTAVVAEGVDALVSAFFREAATLGPKAGIEAVKAAGKAAERMRQRVPVAEGDLLDSITADKTPTIDGGGVYADAGPDRTANPGAFKAHFQERGTVRHGPQPFAGPAGDETLPEFVDNMRKLPKL